MGLVPTGASALSVMEFLAPGFLFLLPLAAAPWMWRSARRTPKHTALRTLCLTLALLALARPAAVVRNDQMHAVIITDASASLSATERARADAALSEWQQKLPANLVIHHTAPVDADWTLTDAVASATTQFPADEPAAIILASDGQSRRDWRTAFAHSQELNLPVHAIPLQDDAAELRIVGMETPDGLRVGHPGTVRLWLSGGPARVRVQLSSEQMTELSATAESWVQGRSSIDLEFEPNQAGFMNLQAELESLELDGGHDMRAQDNRWQTTVAVQPPLPVLYLGMRAQQGRDRLGELLGPGIDLQTAGSGNSGGASSSATGNADPPHFETLDLSAYAAVILDDRPASSVPEAFQQRLLDAVTNRGMGLLMSGGDGAFGPGGWHDTALADVLPVEFQQKEEKRDPSTTLVVIIDTSGSMGGNRVQLAKEVSRLAIRRLLPHDKVGIVEFYGAKRWAAPIQPASNSIELERALNRLDAGGGTVILPAVEEAFYGLQNVHTRYKHVLILTDGGVETGPFESMMRRMADKGMNVSTVLIGSQAHSEFLVNLANWGKGRFYHVPNRFNLPEVILKQPASAKLPAYRPGNFGLQTRGGSAWWGSADPKELPPVNGYVECRSRPQAEVVIKTEEGGHPVLSSWRYGAGRVTALMTQPTGPGTASWAEWDGYGAFLAQVVQRTAADSIAPFRFHVARNGQQLTVTANAKLQNAPASPPVTEPQLTWLRTGPAQFASQMAWPADQEFTLQGAGPVFATSPAFADLAPEFQVDPASAMPVGELATTSGGGALPQPGAVVGSSAGRSLELKEYAPWLLIAALLLFVFEIYYRRRPLYGVVA
jgi:Ca-activated chloride channel homolog